jgi:hydroxymethylpyrimidine/phosphomethylpyrimidine kinase
LSAGIAALLAQGIDVSDAVREACDFLGQSLAAGFRVGMGDAMPDRLFWATDVDAEGAGEPPARAGDGSAPTPDTPSAASDADSDPDPGAASSGASAGRAARGPVRH